MAWLQVLALEIAHAPNTIVMVCLEKESGEQFVVSTPSDGVVAPLTRSKFAQMREKVEAQGQESPHLASAVVLPSCTRFDLRFCRVPPCAIAPCGCLIGAAFVAQVRGS